MIPELPDDEECKGTCDWPHAPPHRLSQAGVYFVTARTLQKRRLFDDEMRLDLLAGLLKVLATKYGWKLEAWAVLANHYHFVAHAPDGAGGGESLPTLINHLHSQSSRELNRLDRQPGRKVWANYRETHLTFPTSYLARLNYTHQNAVHHGLVAVANQYQWCSAADFERACTPAWVRTIYSFPTNALTVDDED